MEGTGKSVIGRTLVIKGRVTAKQQPLDVLGRIEGIIDHDSTLTVEPDGSIDATLKCREAKVAGTVSGLLFATERVSIAESGKVSGRIAAPLFSVVEGAKLKGTVEMDADPEALLTEFEKLSGVTSEAREGSRKPAAQAREKSKAEDAPPIETAASASADEEDSEQQTVALPKASEPPKTD